MEWRKRVRICVMAALVTSVILFLPLFVFAGGLTNEPLGVEDYLIGVAPPPSMAVKIYLQWYHGQNLINESGNISRGVGNVSLDKLNVFVDANRFLWVTPLKFQVAGFDAFVSWHSIFPMVKVNLHLDAGTPAGPVDIVDQSHSGLADVTFGPGITWHHSSGFYHFITAVDIVAPTGSYTRGRPVNVGNNVWSIHPGFLWTVFPPFYPNIDISMRMFYSFNTRNNDYQASPGLLPKTYLDSGQSWQFDYDIMHAIWGGKPGLQLRGGLGGYFYDQTTKDKSGDPWYTGGFTRRFATGPALMFDYKSFIFSAHVYWETAERSATEGVQTQLTILYKF